MLIVLHKLPLRAHLRPCVQLRFKRVSGNWSKSAKGHEESVLQEEMKSSACEGRLEEE